MKLATQPSLISAIPATSTERRVGVAILFVLIALFLVQTWSASLQKSPVWDEPIHIAAGLSYIETGQIVVNQEHPPLLKEIAGLSMRLVGIRWPPSTDPAGLTSANLAPVIATGSAIISGNGPDKVMFWSRLPFILLAAVYAYGLYLLGHVLVGRLAALGAVALYAFDPNIIAHSFLVTTDAGVAGFTIFFLLALWHYLRRPGWRRMIWAGLALGLALCTKFSAVALLPISAVLLAAAALWPIEDWEDRAQAIAQPLSRNAPCACGSGRKYKNCHGRNGETRLPTQPPLKRLFHYALAAAGMCVIAIVVVQIIYVFPRDPFQYITGYHLVNANHRPDFRPYMAGQLQKRFYSYYLVAYLLKEPLPSIILALLGLASVLHKRTIPRLGLLFLLIPPVVFFVAYTLLSDDMGVRYIIPVLLFSHLLGGLAVSQLLRSAQIRMQALGVALCLWLVIAAVGIYPDHLSYFNEAACLIDHPGRIGLDGGSRCGVAWLEDSNIDWGQGLRTLRTWLESNAPGKTVHLGYFGSFAPESYGIRYEPLEARDLVAPHIPGLYVVSAAYVARAQAGEAFSAGGDWLRRPPKAVVGHAYYVYDVLSVPGAIQR